ncbi:MAG: aldo/keto reductase [Cyanobacteriota bacterium]
MANLLTKVQLGQTNLHVSKLCFGTLALGPYHSKLSIDEGSSLLVQAYNNGINFWDTAELYETYEYIRSANEKLGCPEDLIISSRSFSRTYHEMAESIDNTLNSLDIKSIPIFGLHELSNINDFNNSLGAFKALKEAKKNKLIQYIAITMHSVESVKIAAEQDWVDIVFPLYNKAGLGIIGGNTIQMSEAIEYAYNKGKGIYIMKVLAGGHLSSSPEESIKFALNNKAIHSIAIGMDNIDEMLMNLAIFTDDKVKINLIKPNVKAFKRIINVDPWCEGCGKCIRICPNSAITLQFSQATVDHNKCILCGYCASACDMFCLKVVKQP